MRCQFIRAEAVRYPVAVLCRVLQVSQSGYYAWRSRTESLRVQQNRQLTQKIQSLFAASRQTYGSPRIYADLKALGVACGVHRVARLMRKAAIGPTLARRFVVTTNADHALPVAQNCLERGFTAAKANVRWVSDITYLWTAQGWLYLAVVLDLFSRRVIGWSLAPTLHKQVVLNALEMAMQGRHPGAGLLLHSDRGSQYASLAYQQRLLQAGVTCSMSRKGDCWDNAPAESFFATLKRELVSRSRFETREAARGAVFEWIEVWYNRKRRHSTLGYLSPVQFEEQKTNLA